MFDEKTDLSARVTDAVDLVIDFATLGEYGLEPIEMPASPCEGRIRAGSRRSTGTWSAAVNRFAVSHG